MSAPLFLGLDASTQSLKATIIEPTLNVVAEYAVVYDSDLPEFKTSGGVHRGADGLTVTSPPLMWVAARFRFRTAARQRLSPPRRARGPGRAAAGCPPAEATEGHLHD